MRLASSGLFQLQRKSGEFIQMLSLGFMCAGLGFSDPLHQAGLEFPGLEPHVPALGSDLIAFASSVTIS